MRDDARDERFAKMFEVEPLDDVSRRRLVRTAMQASGPAATTRRTWRLVAAAALVAIVVGGGVAYLATRDTNTTNPTALTGRNADRANGTASAAAPPSAAASGVQGDTAQSSAQRKLAVAGSVADLGEFGDLTTAAELNRARTAFSSAAAGGAASPQSKTAADRTTSVASLLSELESRPCAGDLPEGTIVALGRARLGARDAIVVETEQPDGSDSLDAVVTDPCEVRPLD